MVASVDALFARCNCVNLLLCFSLLTWEDPSTFTSTWRSIAWPFPLLSAFALSFSPIVSSLAEQAWDEFSFCFDSALGSPELAPSCDP